jgi:hypothetical protein
MPLHEVCKKCLNQMGDDELEGWRIIKRVLDNHKYPGYEQGVLLNFGSSQCDFKEKIK